MEQALIQMAKQIAKLQEENDRLKQRSKKTPKKEKINPSQERFYRVASWVARQYQRDHDAAIEKNKERLRQIAKDNIHLERPIFILENDCMDIWPSSNIKK